MLLTKIYLYHKIVLKTGLNDFSIHQNLKKNMDLLFKQIVFENFLHTYDIFSFVACLMTCVFEAYISMPYITITCKLPIQQH